MSTPKTSSGPTRRTRSSAQRVKTDPGHGIADETTDVEAAESAPAMRSASTDWYEALQSAWAAWNEAQARYTARLGELAEALNGKLKVAWDAYVESCRTIHEGSLAYQDYSAAVEALQALGGTGAKGGVDDELHRLRAEYLRDLAALSARPDAALVVPALHADFVVRAQQLAQGDDPDEASQRLRTYYETLYALQIDLVNRLAGRWQSYMDALASAWKDIDGDKRLARATEELADAANLAAASGAHTSTPFRASTSRGAA
jgi:hypothetical protein